MTSSDEFKQALKAGKLTEALVVAMGEAIKLNITTSVVDGSDDLNWLPQAEVKPGYRMHTQIDVIQGDINNEIGEKFLESEAYSQLRRFHLQQVDQGTQIIRDNLKSLQQILGIWLKVQKYNTSVPNQSPIGVDTQILIPQTDRDSPSPEEIIDPPSPPTPTAQDTQDLPTIDPANLESSLEDDWIDGDDGITDLFESFSDGKQLDESSSSHATASVPPTPAPEMPVSDLEIEDWEIASTSNFEDDGGEDEDNIDNISEDVELLSLEDLLEEESETEEFLPEELTSEAASDSEQPNYAIPEVLLVVNEQNEADWLPEELKAPESIDLDTQAYQTEVDSEQEDDWGDLFVPESSLDTDEFGFPSPSILSSPISQSQIINDSVGDTNSENDEDWDDLLPPASTNVSSFAQEPLEPLYLKHNQIVSQNKQASQLEEEADNWLEEEWDDWEFEQSKSSAAIENTEDKQNLTSTQNPQDVNDANTNDANTVEMAAAEDDFGFLFEESVKPPPEGKLNQSTSVESSWEDEADELSTLFEDELFGNLSVRRNDQETNQDRD